MKFSEIKGNLLEVTSPGVIGHGVNCCGIMRKGVAAQIKRRWPSVYEDYRAACLGLFDGTPANPGDFQLLLVQEDGEPGEKDTWHIANLFTQRLPGANAELPALASAVSALVDCIESTDYIADHLYLPQIGCHVGGLSWRDVRVVLEDIATSGPVDITVLTLPEPVEIPEPSGYTRSQIEAALRSR